MLKTLSNLTLLLLIPIVSFSQVNIVLTPTNYFKLKSEDVWSMTVSNTSGQDLQVYFKALVTDEMRKPIVELTSGKVSLSQGVNVFNSQLLLTTTKNYMNQEAAEYELLSGELPPGNYQYCVQLVCASTECSETLGLEKAIKVCEEITKETTTPLLLSFPEDRSKIDEKRPTFTWIAPMPIGANPELTYKMTLVELTENQSPEDGLRRNRALYSSNGIQSTSLTFPSELEDLQVEHRYGWQVEAWLGQTFVAVSEAWEFEIDEEEQTLMPMPFVRMSKVDQSRYNAVNDLKFVYFETLKETKLNYKFYDSRSKDVTPHGVVLKTTHGDNKFVLNLNDFGFESGQEYTMVITAANGEVYKLRFKYIFQFTE